MKNDNRVADNEITFSVIWVAFFIAYMTLVSVVTLLAILIK